MGEEPARFDRRALSFLRANAAPRRPAGHREWGHGSDRVALHVVSNKDLETQHAELGAARRWRALVFDAGFAWLDGPVEYGGGGLPTAFARRYRELERAFDVPDLAPLRPGISIIAPVILQHGGDALCGRYLARIQRGDVVLCQLFSEPGAGSDLAAVATRAERVAGGWALTGQKVWTSGGAYSDVGQCIARTSTEGTKHSGLSVFLVDMRARGVTVRPLRQMTGGAEFSEVFLDDVFAPDGDLLGAAGQGWEITLATLMNERAALGAELLPDASLEARLVDLAHHVGRDGDAVVRRDLARIHVELVALRTLLDRILSEVPEGAAPGPELSLGKLGLTRVLARISELVADLLGPRLVADTGEWGTYAWSEFVLGIPGMRIGGGTDEILRTTVAERVLGLPREPRPHVAARD